MTFKDKEHENFFFDTLARAGVTSSDTYRAALFYCLGTSETCRRIIDHLYDFRRACIIPEGLNDPVQTGTSLKVTRLAFNLFTDNCPSDERTDMMLYLPS